MLCEHAAGQVGHWPERIASGMVCAVKTRCMAAVLLIASSTTQAQTADPSGRWEGTVEAPGIAVPLTIDLAKSGEAVTGAVSMPAEKIAGLPLKVALDGRTIKLHARSDQGIVGTLSEDGSTITADFQAGPITIPFILRRTGDAQFEPPARNPPISPQLEGTWNATMTMAGTEIELLMTLANQQDGTSIGRVVQVNQGGLEIPVSTIAQTGANVVLELKAVSTSFSGTLSADGSEIMGTASQGGRTAPVTFHRTSPPAR